jgi:hypothetical protein
VSEPPKCRDSNKLIFSQIKDNQFLIESRDANIRIGGENEYAISYIDFDGGPLIHLGTDFLGRGKVGHIEIIDTENSQYLMCKITLL